MITRKQSKACWKYFLLLFCIAYGCKKTSENRCAGVVELPIGFIIRETVGDTSLVTDTAFSGSTISFATLSPYSKIKWTIGNDPRVFTQNTVSLYFDTPESASIFLSATNATPCYTRDEVVQKRLVVVKRDSTNKSPLIGSYYGADSDNPGTPYTVKVRYWAGSKYPFWSAQGAYSIHNFPRGYRDTTKWINGTPIPEIDGEVCANGYKNLYLSKPGNWRLQGVKAYGSLRQGVRDTLLISYTIFDTTYFAQTGQYRYFNKQFIGIKQ